MVDSANALSSKTDTSIPNSLLDLNALARFAAVVRHDGFSAAARAIGAPRQSLHRTVDRLEEELGVRLLDRSARSVRPTATGRRLYEHAVRVLVAAEDATAMARAAKDHPQGLLRVTAPPLFGQLRLGHVVQQFLSRWPDVRIEADFTHATSDLVREDYDLAIRIRVPPGDDYVARRIGEAESVCCAAPTYLQTRPPLRHPADLHRGHEHVLFGPPVALPWRFEQGGETTTFHTTTPRLRVDDFRVATAAVLDGLGIGLLPRALALSHLSAGRLLRLFDDWRVEPSSVWAVYTGRAKGNPTLQAFVDMLREHMGGPEPLA
ncbi:MAG: LysR family transcriptional regulator [Myxococcota bacterium]